MKRWWRFIIIILLGLVLSLRFNQCLHAQVLPSQLVKQAQISYQKGEFASSLKLLQQANNIYHNQAKYLPQAQILALTSLTQQQLGQWKLAEQNIAEGFALIENIPSTKRKTQVLAQMWNTRGHLQFALGKNDAALSDWQKAEDLYTKIKDQTGIAGSLLNTAQALEKMGFYRRSCDRILRALKHRDRDCENFNSQQIKATIDWVKQAAQPWQIAGLNQLGNSLLLNGKLLQAEEIAKASQMINSSLANPSPLTEAKILLNLGNINKAIAFQAQENEESQSFLGYSQKAIKYYQQLVDYSSYPQIARKYRLPAQLNMLSLLVLTQQWQESQTLIKQIELYPPTASQVQNLYGEIKFAQNLERLKQNQVDISYTWQDIADIYSKAVKQAQEIGDLRVQSYGLGYLGLLQANQPFLKIDRTPQQLLESALTLAQQIKAPEIAYRWQWQLGKIQAKETQRKLAIANYQASLATLASLRQDLTALAREIQFDFHEQIEPIYKEYADLLLKEKPLSEQNLIKAIDAIESLQVAELDNYFQDACIVSESIDINSIDKDTAVIYTLILPSRLEVIMATNDIKDNTSQPHFDHHSVSIKQSNLEAIVKQLRSYITEPDRTIEVQKLSTQLYDLLIRPLETDLAINRPQNLVFILDSSLQTIPMSVLYDGDRYLAEKYAIALTPGLRMLHLQPQTEKSSFLVGGITQALQIEKLKFSALKNVAAELGLFPRSETEVLLDQKFTPETLLKQLNSSAASHVHLATHGQFSSNPHKTFLLMWQKLLTIKDFGNLLQQRNQRIGVPINLLVLSACDTATGDRYGALGLGGVAVRSGAVSTIATLWQVNDESTAELMKNFYRYLKQGNSKAKALQLSQLELWQKLDKDWQVPAFWSAYIMIGNWR